MRIHLLWLTVLLALGKPVCAESADMQSTFTRLSACVQQENGAPCRSLLTVSSDALYTRFVGYGLMPCLPKNAAYLSEELASPYRVVRASITVNGTPRFARLYFVQEEETWKLDLPATLQAGIGNDWEQKLNMTEQLYLLLGQQMGPKLDCGLVQNLVK